MPSPSSSQTHICPLHDLHKSMEERACSVIAELHARTGLHLCLKGLRLKRDLTLTSCITLQYHAHPSYSPHLLS